MRSSYHSSIVIVILISSCNVEVLANNLANLTANFYGGIDSQLIDNSFVVLIYQKNLLKTHSFVLHFPKLAPYILVLRSTRFYGNSSSDESTCYPVKMGVYRTKFSNGDFIYHYPLVQYRFTRRDKKRDFTLIPLQAASVFKMNYLHRENCIRISAVADFFGIVAYDTNDDYTCPNEQNRIHVFFENKNHTLCVYQLDESVHSLLISFGGITIEESRMSQRAPVNLLLSTGANNSVTTSAPLKSSIERSKHIIFIPIYILIVMCICIVLLIIPSFITFHRIFKRIYFKCCRVRLRRSGNTPNEALLDPEQKSENINSAEILPCYPINNRDNERGFCMIINIQHFPNNPAMNRAGESDIDRDRLKSTFEKLRYKVLVYNDLTLAEIQSEIKILAHIAKSDHDSVVICLLSHGGDQNFIYTSDNQQYHYRNFITEDLSLGNCRALINKPKIVIVQACRGGLMDVDVVRSNMNVNSQLLQRDFLFYYSMIEDFAAWRNERKGSLFIATLCKCITQLHKGRDILDIFTRVNALTIKETFQSDKYPATCELVTCLTKKFMF